MYLVVECLVAFFQYLLFCLFVCVPFLSPKARGGENWFALVFFVLSIQICSAICFTIFCLPLGEGHGSQDSQVRGKTDENKWKVETRVVNVKS